MRALFYADAEVSGQFAAQPARSTQQGRAKKRQDIGYNGWIAGRVQAQEPAYKKQGQDYAIAYSVPYADLPGVGSRWDARPIDGAN